MDVRIRNNIEPQPTANSNYFTNYGREISTTTARTYRTSNNWRQNKPSNNNFNSQNPWTASTIQNFKPLDISAKYPDPEYQESMDSLQIQNPSPGSLTNPTYQKQLPSTQETLKTETTSNNRQQPYQPPINFRPGVVQITPKPREIQNHQLRMFFFL